MSKFIINVKKTEGLDNQVESSRVKSSQVKSSTVYNPYTVYSLNDARFPIKIDTRYLRISWRSLRQIYIGRTSQPTFCLKGHT